MWGVCEFCEVALSDAFEVALSDAGAGLRWFSLTDDAAWKEVTGAMQTCHVGIISYSWSLCKRFGLASLKIIGFKS